jgi:hemerythrin superfamily protein
MSIKVSDTELMTIQMVLRTELLELLDEHVKHIEENAKAILEYAKYDEKYKIESRCRSLTALYLNEIKILFSGWPEAYPEYSKENDNKIIEKIKQFYAKLEANECPK